MEVALSCLAASIPLTAAILKFIPKREVNGNGTKYVTQREYDTFKGEVSIHLNRIENSVNLTNLKLDGIASHIRKS